MRGRFSHPHFLAVRWRDYRAGTITGSYTDANNAGHGFLRARDGTFTTFDPPGAVGTFPLAINPAGAVTGSYTDANFVVHGFLLSR